jgi:glycosyltransferase involved in cell wall biosynthesis
VIRASIVIPALNEEQNLSRVLPVVTAQLGPNDEVIVVDNGSDDGTVRVARSLGARVVAESKRGRGQARNAGFQHASGDFVVFLDADCLVKPNWLQNLLSPFQDPLVGCVGGEIINAYVDTPLARYLASKGHLSQMVTFAHPFMPYAQTGNVAFRRDVIRLIGVFDDLLEEGEDADICWRMQLESDYRIAFAPEACVEHCFDLSPGSFLRQKRRHAYGAVLLYKKYRSRWKREDLSLKSTYWEYRSIVRRSIRLGTRCLMARMGFLSDPGDDQRYQLLIEIGEKWGRIEGTIRQRVWFV